MSFDDVQENVMFQVVRNAIARWLMQRMNDREVFELLEYALGKPYRVRVTFEIVEPVVTPELIEGLKEYAES